MIGFLVEWTLDSTHVIVIDIAAQVLVHSGTKSELRNEASWVTNCACTFMRYKYSVKSTL